MRARRNCGAPPHAGRRPSGFFHLRRGEESAIADDVKQAALYGLVSASLFFYCAGGQPLVMSPRAHLNLSQPPYRCPLPNMWKILL